MCASHMHACALSMRVCACKHVTQVGITTDIAKSKAEYEASYIKRAMMNLSGSSRDHMPLRVYPGGLSVSRTIGDVFLKERAPGAVSNRAELFVGELWCWYICMLVTSARLWLGMPRGENCPTGRAIHAFGNSSRVHT